LIIISTFAQESSQAVRPLKGLWPVVLTGSKDVQGKEDIPK
jgi:hypothetical protein